MKGAAPVRIRVTVWDIESEDIFMQHPPAMRE